MNKIKDNPFRILGLPANTQEREIQRQLSRINRFMEINRQNELEYDLPIIGPFVRSQDSVRSAYNAISNQKERIIYFTFWFVCLSNVDQLAFENIRNNNIKRAIELWETTLESDKVNTQNISAYHNLPLLYLLKAYEDNRVDYTLLNRACQLRVKISTSDIFNELINHIIGGNGINHLSEKYLSVFINDVINDEIINSKTGKASLKEMLNLLNSFPVSIKCEVIQRITKEPLEKIEKAIEEVANKREKNHEEGYNLGTRLYSRIKGALLFLKLALGENDLTYLMIANKTANELISCAIAYFNHFYDDPKIDSGGQALELAQKAKSIGERTNSNLRIMENIEIFEKYISTKSERESAIRIKPAINFIINKVESFHRLPASVDNAKALMDTCLAKLNEIKSQAGHTSEDYIFICSIIARNVEGMCITVLNHRMDEMNYNSWHRNAFLDESRRTLQMITTLLTWPLLDEVRTKLIQNKQVIQSNISKMDASKVSRGNDNCYIATLVYGDKYHPQVDALRYYRDNILKYHLSGRAFIWLYYKISPSLVIYLKYFPKVQAVIKKALDSIIRRIK